MENKQSPSKNKLFSIEEDKLLREVNAGCSSGKSRLSKKSLLLDLEILRKNPTLKQPSQRVLVSIKSRGPAIKTLYIAEKNRYKKSTEKSGSRARLGIGDHSSFTTHISENNSEIGAACGINNQNSKREDLSVTEQEETTSASRCTHAETGNTYNELQRSAEKCNVYTNPKFNLYHPNIEENVHQSKGSPNKLNIATFIVSKTSSVDLLHTTVSTIRKLSKRIDHLERKILRQEMVFRSLDPNVPLSSSDEGEDPMMRSSFASSRPGCSYIQQYSHVPETSAFQRNAHQASPLSPSRATTLDKEHNSEQYGRDFTAYDGITARGRRQCASVPCKRNDFPKMAAERVHKIRHKLNPVRDYRLMDTVHYLAQGEFAPRDDGIKLTPSREGVLSDIIWEDVCRTHWPSTRLGRRGAPERCSTRCELQRLIDSLLRERVAHVERRRRRHYRIVKLNHRHESCRPLGKTGDIIVASHKKKDSNEDREVPINDHNAASDLMPSDRRWEEQSSRRSLRNHDRLMYLDSQSHQRRRLKQDDSSPGPSNVVPRATAREPTCCYNATSPFKLDRNTGAIPKITRREDNKELTSESSSSCKPHPKNPRLVVKKETSHMKHNKDEPNLEQYILLPTLVIRTPSNVKRQKKFNELYHRILNVHLNNGENNVAVESETADRKPNQNRNKKDAGFNINVTLSGSVEETNNNHKGKKMR